MIPPEPPHTQETYAWPLWKHLHQEHGLLLLESEIHEIIRHAAPFSAENRQLQQDVADLNTRLIERQRDMMAASSNSETTSASLPAPPLPPP
jgi:hypothetical protein